MEHHPTLKKRVFSTQFFSVSFPLPSLQLSPFAMLQWISRFRHPHEVTKRTLGDWNLERKVTIHHHTPTLEGWAEGHARQREGIWRIYWCPSVGDTRGVQANPNLHHPNQMVQMERSQEAYPFNFFFRTWLFCCMTVYVCLSPAWESLGLCESLPCLWPESASPLQSHPMSNTQDTTRFRRHLIIEVLCRGRAGTVVRTSCRGWTWRWNGSLSYKSVYSS